MKRPILYAFLLLLPFIGSAQSDTVKIKDSFFDPETLAVAVGTEVVWENVGGLNHTSTSGTGCSPDNNWDSGTLSSGQTFSVDTFSTASTYEYYCEPHCANGMTGVIHVGQTTSIEDRSASIPEIELYPHPFNDQLNIEFTGNEEEARSIEVFNITGKRVEEVNPSEFRGKKTLQLDASQWESGVYFVKFDFQKGSRTEKVIKR